MSFDEIWNNDWALSSCSRDDAEDFYNEGARCQQAKIDCMQVELDGANERAMMMFNHKNAMVDKMQSKIDELQERIDEITNHVDINFDEDRDDDQHSYWSGYNQAMCELNDILKGNKDEN